MYRILLVDDDRELLDANEAYFSSHGYVIYKAESARDALAILRGAVLDCVILDIDLPDKDGFQVCAAARKRTSIPIVFLSGYTEEESRIKGLSIGGDDYVTKPFSVAELELRVRLRIRRSKTALPMTTLEFGPLTLDLSGRTVSYEGKTKEFSRLEFDILSFLALHPQRTFSYEELYAGVWDEPIQEGLHCLQVNIAKVRQKLAGLAPGRSYIRTVRGKGYLFDPEGGAQPPTASGE